MPMRPLKPMPRQQARPMPAPAPRPIAQKYQTAQAGGRGQQFLANHPKFAAQQPTGRIQTTPQRFTPRQPMQSIAPMAQQQTAMPNPAQPGLLPTAQGANQVYSEQATDPTARQQIPMQQRPQLASAAMDQLGQQMGPQQQPEDQMIY